MAPSIRLAFFVPALAASIALPVAKAVAAEFAKKDPLVIGYSIQSSQDPYWQGYVHGIETEMKKFGFTKLVTDDSQASARKQVSGSLALINNGITALIISPQEPSALARASTPACTRRRDL